MTADTKMLEWISEVERRKQARATGGAPTSYREAPHGEARLEWEHIAPAVTGRGDGGAFNAQIRLAQLDAADGPVPIPSTWLSQPEDPQSWLRRQLVPCMIGAAVGVVVIGSVLILGGFMDTSREARRPEAVAPKIERASALPGEGGLSLAALSGPASVAELPSLQLPSVGSAPFALVPSSAGDPSLILAAAELLASGGEIDRARTMLDQSGFDGHPLIAFALAETFDPNMLAAWGVRGGMADAPRARALYQQALTGGVDRARSRIAQLQ